VAACYPAGRSRPYPTLRAVFAALAAGDVQAAVVPVENSQAGSIDETYDLLLEHHERLTIVASEAERLQEIGDWRHQSGDAGDGERHLLAADGLRPNPSVPHDGDAAPLDAAGVSRRRARPAARHMPVRQDTCQ